MSGRPSRQGPGRDVVLERREGQGLPLEEQNGKQERERARVCESANGSVTARKPRVRYAGTAEWRALGDLEMPPTAGLAVPGNLPLIYRYHPHLRRALLSFAA